MSNFESNTSHSIRARAFVAFLIIMLIIFATIVVIESSSLKWPLATDIGNIFAPPKGSSNRANSSLLISAGGSTPVIAWGCFNNQTCVPSLNGSFRGPISNASIVITTSGSSPALVAHNYTNAQGEGFFLLPAGTYEVNFTSSLANLTIPVATSSGNTTELDIWVNGTAYPCTFIDISNPVSPSLIAPWNTIFLTIQSNSAITQNANESLFLQFLPVAKFNIQVLGGYYSSAEETQWLEIRLDSIANVSVTYGVDVLSYFSSYTMTEYPMLNATLAATGTTNGTFPG